MTDVTDVSKGESLLPGKALRQLSKAVQRVEVWALSISGQRLTVKLYPVYCVDAWLIQVTEWRGGEREYSLIRLGDMASQ